MSAKFNVPRKPHEITISPILARKGLRLPASIARCPEFPWLNILVSAGLTIAQAKLLWREVIFSDRVPNPNHFWEPPHHPFVQEDLETLIEIARENAPLASRIRTPRGRSYNPFGRRVYFCGSVDLHDTTTVIVRDFKRQLRIWGKEHGIQRAGSMARSRPIFMRDLTVFALSSDRKWKVENIDDQLSYMGLGPLTSLQADPYVSRRKIVSSVRRLLAVYRRTENASV